MTRVTLCLILILLTDVVETNVVPNVTCSAKGDVYIRPGGNVSNVSSKNYELMFVSSKDTVCDYQIIDDAVKIHGCLQTDIYPPVDVFLRDGADGLFFLRITCLPYEDPLQQETRKSAYQNRAGSDYRTDPKLSIVRRRRQVSSDIVKGNDEDDFSTFQTSVSFSVKLNFSSNDEISIACNPDNLGILYVSNPDPIHLTYVLSFSQLTERKCNTEFIEGRHFVAVGGCNMRYPIVVSFNSIEFSSIVGGSRFKVYNVSCSDKVSIDRVNILPDSYDPGNAGVGSVKSSIFITMELLMFTLMYL